MILVDTSIWIKFLGGQQPYLTEVDRLLSLDQVCAHELVYGELLMGDRGGRKRFLAKYKIMEHAPSVRHASVVTLVEEKDLQGRGVGWIDVQLLASALVGGMKLWTADPRFDAMAKEFGVAHRVR
jgi:predicted nucleic acid-binding protein